MVEAPVGVPRFRRVDQYPTKEEILSMEKKVRFGDLVRTSGRPQIATLWTAPEKDRTFSRALKESRVMTVMEPPQKTPFGMLGLKEDPHSVFLIFPRALDLTPNTRVIGINYQLAEQPELSAPTPAAKPQHPTRAEPKGTPKPRTPAPKPKLAKRFKVRLRRTATLDETHEVEALNRREAERQVIENAKREPFDLDRAAVREEVVK